ncbi:glycosyltransferase [Duganella ginsengisoli]|uniref:Glycosyltransferase n=2 Tax=Pseudoduganella ginsengisoli TaxID=1462440 RepID=A0A6L6Q3Y1_9BURK|nr:glycosyltransferase family 4 protein [Pseudoduganella ginsengisoli]MTW04021.1 glycosyltransferase [Pseudoduganella ginsengisoli]
MAGTSLESPGGMTSVVRMYRDMGLFDAWNVRYLASYEKPGKATQVRVMAGVAASLLWLLLRGKVSLLHVHSASRGSFWRKSVLCALARLFGVPYVFHLHSGEFPVFYDQECGPRAQRWVRRTLEGAHTLVALTGQWQTALARIAPNAAITVLGNPVHVPSALPPAHGATPPQLLFLGRLRDKKGVADIVRAMPAVLARYPDAVFTLAGDGDLEGTATLARELNVDHALRLPGWVDGAAKDALVAQATMLLLPSYFEGLPVCVLEAMADGVPVIATTVGGIPEALDHGRCGVLHAPGDVDALAGAIVALLDDAPRRQALREAAFARAQHTYSAAAVRGAIDALYDEVLAPKREARTVR